MGHSNWEGPSVESRMLSVIGKIIRLSYQANLSKWKNELKLRPFITLTVLDFMHS